MMLIGTLALEPIRTFLAKIVVQLFETPDLWISAYIEILFLIYKLLFKTIGIILQKKHII